MLKKVQEILYVKKSIKYIISFYEQYELTINVKLKKLLENLIFVQY